MKKNLIIWLCGLFVLFGIYPDDLERMYALTDSNYKVYGESNGLRFEWYSSSDGFQEFLLQDSDYYISDGWISLSAEIPLFKCFELQANGAWERTETVDFPFLIKGGKYIAFIDSQASYERANSFTNRDSMYYQSPMSGGIGFIASYTYQELSDRVSRPTDAVGDSWFLPSFGVKKIISSSYYSEPTNSGFIEYDSTMLSNIFLIDSRATEWIRHNPWVAGKESNAAGIGESLTIEFIVPKDNIVVLNGYVDPLKRHLYNANNRVKTAIIKSLDANNPFELEYTFEDYVHFAEINFPEKVDKVEFIIKDVYKGERWNDTCVSAVITRWEPNPPPQYPTIIK